MPKRNTGGIVASALACLLAMNASSRAALIFSESFESPAANDAGGAGSAFYAVGSGNLKVYDELNYFNPATDGTQYLVTNPDNGPSGGTISWSFNVGVGLYTLTFDERDFNFFSTTVSLAVTVTAVTTGDLLSQTVNDNSNGAPTPIHVFNQTFTTSTAGIVTLQLTDTSASASGNSTDMIIDNIQVNGPPVPEPASVGVMTVAAALGLR